MGIDSSIFVIILALLEVICLVILSAAFFSGKSKRQSIKEFIVLTIMFIVYNGLYIVGLMPSNQLVHLGLSTLITSYFVYFIFAVSLKSDDNDKKWMAFYAILVASILFNLFVNKLLTWVDLTTILETRLVFPTVLMIGVSLFIVLIVVAKLQSWRSATVIAIITGVIFAILNSLIIPMHVDAITNQILALNVCFVLAGGAYVITKEPKPADYNLSPRQLEVAELMAKGYTYQEIGDRLKIERDTASSHGSVVIRKTNCSGKDEFVKKFGKLPK